MNRLGRPNRKLIRLCRSHSLRQKAPAPISAVQRCRYSSSVSNGSLLGAASIDIEAIRAEMLARPPQIHSDMMSSINSHQLTTALSEFLPEECYANQQISFGELYRPEVFAHGRRLVPPGHHFVYFPLQRRGSSLCPDGTDPYHAPRDTPFTRRMWAGGSIQGFRGLAMGEGHALCLERIVDVNVLGSAGAEKIFVEVLREYVDLENFKAIFGLREVTLKPQSDPPEHNLTTTARPRDPREYDIKGITERRTLVFMREPSDEEKKMSLEQEQRIFKAQTKMDYSVTLTPTPTLLFHYSALTYNAHRIHLDRSYCREVEGHRDLIVHGPLSLTLMLSVLQSRLDTEGCEFIDNIDYRHLAPLYVRQPMRVCLKLKKESRAKKKNISDEEQSCRAGENEQSDDKIEVGRNRWDLWVENQDGSLCVRGTAETVKPRPDTDTHELK
ncbi:hypothetical protein F4782DRAFT_403316 [Xylaria castorea]|nr:hypothetical protein F4782DRAFT_403316 [Xylaria castorea]